MTLKVKKKSGINCTTVSKEKFFFMKENIVFTVVINKASHLFAYAQMDVTYQFWINRLSYEEMGTLQNILPHWKSSLYNVRTLQNNCLNRFIIG